MSELPQTAQIIEVGLRDGLQNEDQIIPVEIKLEIIDQLITAGIKRIQVASFVHPELVPQMAHAEELCARLKPVADVEYSGLALNMKGLERAYNVGLKHIDMGVSVSEVHSMDNTGRPVAEKFEEFKEMAQQARKYGMVIRGGIYCVWGHIVEAIPQEKVVAMVAEYVKLELDELALADSTGMANPIAMRSMLEAVLPVIGDTPIVLHLHDTRGLGMANVFAALHCGVNRFDTAFGGLGGCPFIKGATGNIATEDTVYMLEEMGIDTGVDRHKAAQVSRRLEKILNRQLPGKLYRIA